MLPHDDVAVVARALQRERRAREQAEQILEDKARELYRANCDLVAEREMLENANQQLDMLHILGPKYGLDPQNMVQMMLGLPDWAKLNSDLFMHTVIPNLARLGLITERTESKYRERGMMFGDRFGAGMDADVQASMTAS